MMKFKSIRTSYTSKVVISFLTIQLILGGAFPSMASAATEGPTQPEFNSFTPIGASDMVDLSSGDFNYSIPVMDVGGYPLSLGYNSATNFDTASSWVGHGWDLSAGQINRSMRAIPDDFDGSDKITTQNNKKDNTTITVGTNLNISLAGFDLSKGKNTLAANIGLMASYNNYLGLSIQPTIGPSFEMHNGFTTSINFTPSSTDGIVIQPQVGFTGSFNGHDGTYGLGANFNSFTNSLSLNSGFTSNFSNAVIKNEQFKVNRGNPSINGTMSVLDFQPAMFNPSYQLGFINTAGSGNFALGGTAFSVDGKPEIYGSIAIQSLKKEYEHKQHKAFGYNNNHLAGYDGMRDFSRLNDRPISIGTSFLSVPQNTYDYYSISGQGISGSFRPQNAQVNYVGDPEVVNTSADISLAAEAAGGNLFKIGGNIAASFNDSRSGYWKKHKGNDAHDNLRAIENPIDNSVLPANFQRNYFKLVGQNTIANSLDNPNPFVESIGDKNPVFFKRKNSSPSAIGGSMTHIESNYSESELNFTSTVVNQSGRMIMEAVIPTSKTIIPVSVKDYNTLTGSYGNDAYGSLNKTFLPGVLNGVDNSKSHHQSGFKVTDDGGAIYNYDLPLYTLNSSQISFSISSNAQKTYSNSQVRYSNNDNSLNNRKGRDHFYEKRTIDPYVHTSLLRSILSSDYRDLSGNGVSPDDLGSYTLFKYKKTDKLIPFRLPVEANEAFYQQGTMSSGVDDKASINYGQKEQAFLERIITKTHVAYFELNDDTNSRTQRKDNIASSTDENDGIDNSTRSRYLSKIYLYSLAQAEKLDLLDDDISGFDPNSVVNGSIKPLKVVHFEYDYSIQELVNQNSGLPNSKGNNGKLTLKKVYFTYGKSEMGRYNPYQFFYNQDDNFKYHNLNKDSWGNYMPNQNQFSLIGDPTNAEYPYTNQTKADENARMFLLSKIKLPSSGEINVDYEADDYAYVQDKKAMKMFKIAGTGSSTDASNIQSSDQATLYSGVDNINDIIFLDVSDDFNWNSISNQRKEELIQSIYLDQIENEPIYFKILSNIYGTSPTSKYKEPITGFVYLESRDSFTPVIVEKDNKHYLALKLQKPTLNGNSSSDKVHPFSKAIWNYSYSYLKTIAFDGEDPSGNLDLTDAVKSLGRNMKAMITLFSGPNRILRSKDCGKIIYTNKSWLRLNEPTGFKKGGGARVRSVEVDSNWDLMAQNQINSSNVNYYGQEYEYISKDGTRSSGVAVNEPLQNEDNPLKVPLEDRSSVSTSGQNTSKLIDKFLAPISSNYIIGPLMSDYYPNPQVTYSRVKIKNTKPQYDGPSTANMKIGSRATGYVVNEFYTSKDFPVIEKNTVPDTKLQQDNDITDFIKALIGFPADIYSGERFIGTQGFYVETNDMNGKPKSQTVYAEKSTGDNFITKSITEYQLTEDGNLDNISTFIDKHGKIQPLEVGVDYDVVNDFRYSSSETLSASVDGNFAAFLLFFPAPVGIPMIKPGGSFHETKTRLATTAKHLHRAGIVKSSTVIDNGSSITTENVAYDYYSRKPIVKKVNNEFNDVIYNFDYPAYWLVDEMANKSINEGMKFKVVDPNQSGGAYRFAKNIYHTDNKIPLLINGDEILVEGESEHYWVTNIQYSEVAGATSFDLIDKDNAYRNAAIGDKLITVVRSAFDNKQGQSIASISMSRNPITLTDGTLRDQLPDFFEEDYEIYNASAIEMKGLWEPDCECGYDKLERDTAGNILFDHVDNDKNPYFHNILGQYRPWKSRAYLTGREKIDMTQDLVNLRKDGFYREFFPFYQFEGNNSDRKLTIPSTLTGPQQEKYERWQYASQVSKISPYGLELENKDPLEEPRHSAAMYGFNQKFPTAVASNTEYRELAFDSFEDYDYKIHDDEHFAFAKALSHTQNPDGTFAQNDTITWGTHITDQEHHTGNYSMEVMPSQIIGVNQTLIPCDNEDVGQLYLNLISYLWNNVDQFQTQRCHPNPMSIPEFAALAPYITRINGIEPSICDLNTYSIDWHSGMIDPYFDSYQAGIYFNFFVNNAINHPNNTNSVNNSGQQPNQSDLYENVFSPCTGNGNTDPGTNLIMTGFTDEFGVPFRSLYSFNDTNDGDCGQKNYFSYLDLSNETCIDCTSFSPHQGYDYVISAWVKEDINRNNITSPSELRDAYPTTYNDASVSIAFADVNGNPVGIPQEFEFKPSGQIINGWQKVYGTFTVDSSANVMKVLLNNTSSTSSAFFDDIRIHPVNGSMKSFVYDDDNFRLRAELDDNNYATFYEYDLEGNLIRIKKETSRGVMTIQESRQSLSKITPQP